MVIAYLDVYPLLEGLTHPKGKLISPPCILEQEADVRHLRTSDG